MRAAMTDSENVVLLDAALLEVLNWRRSSPTVEWAARQLGLDSAQVDDLSLPLQRWSFDTPLGFDR